MGGQKVLGTSFSKIRNANTLSRVPIAFSLLDPEQVCTALSRGLSRPVRYIEGPIEISVPIPTGYREQLDALQDLFGAAKVKGLGAPYWWEGLFDADVTASGSSTKMSQKKKAPERKKKVSGEKQAPKVGDDEDVEADDEAERTEDEAELLRIPRKLWAAWRDIEGYARDIFPVEEKLNRRTWMDDEGDDDYDDDEEQSKGSRD